MMKVRYATAEEFKKYYPDCPYSFKGWVVSEGDEVLLIGGILLDVRFKTVIFNQIKKLPPKTLWQAAKMTIEECKKFAQPLYSIRDTDIKNSKRFLEKLGFKFLQQNNNQEIYILWEH